MAKRNRMIMGLLGAALALFKERDRLAGKTKKTASPPSRRVRSGTVVEYSPDGVRDHHDLVTRPA